MTGMPELTTLCYLVKDGKALMLHRVVKKNDVNKDKWMGRLFALQTDIFILQDKKESVETTMVSL